MQSADLPHTCAVDAGKPVPHVLQILQNMVDGILCSLLASKSVITVRPARKPVQCRIEVPLTCADPCRHHKPS